VKSLLRVMIVSPVLMTSRLGLHWAYVRGTQSSWVFASVEALALHCKLRLSVMLVVFVGWMNHDSCERKN
jgi:hypothetical protein